MKNKKENKILYNLLIIFSIFIIVILGNLALPIIYRFFSYIFYLLSPFIVGFFLAFLLHTLVDKIEEQGINRILSVLLVFFTFIIISIYLISSLIPIIFAQVSDLEKQIPHIYKSMVNFIDNFWVRFDFIPDKYRFNMDDVGDWTMNNVINLNFSKNFMNGILESFNIIVLTPIITYYFLYDYNNIKSRLKKFLCRYNYKFIYNFFKEADEGVGSYFRGLILVMNLMAVVSGLGFSLIGLEYPMLFGFIVGYTNAIPIIGNYIGGIPAVLFALTSSWKLAILTLIVIVVVQLIESNIVTPYIQSKSIDSHPLLILLAFVIFGKCFGIIGMIFAIPLLAIIMLIIKYIRIYYRFRRFKHKKIILQNK